VKIYTFHNSNFKISDRAIQTLNEHHVHYPQGQKFQNIQNRPYEQAPKEVYNESPHHQTPQSIQKYEPFSEFPFVPPPNAQIPDYASTINSAPQFAPVMPVIYDFGIIPDGNIL
jgi:hypothetical protein